MIDTPGFFDTTLTDAQVIAALQQLADVAKEGLVAVIVVVKNGRFTDENQAVIKYIETVLGHEALVKHGMLVVTSTRKSTDELQKELAALPDGNLGRDMACKVGSRLLGVDSAFWRWPPFKTRNDIMHQVEELLATNKSMAVDCDVMSWGARLQQQQLMEFEQQTASLRKQHAEKEQMLIECHANDRENIMNEKRAIEELLQETEDKHDETLKQMANRLELEEKLSWALKSRLENTESEMQQMQEDQQTRVRDLEAKMEEERRQLQTQIADMKSRHASDILQRQEKEEEQKRQVHDLEERIQKEKRASSEETQQLRSQLADMKSRHDSDIQLLMKKEEDKQRQVSDLEAKLAELDNQNRLQPMRPHIQPMPMQPMPMHVMHSRSDMESGDAAGAAVAGLLIGAAMASACVVQ